tara:strand:- start:44 stop:727 length:684 start_codon:yes stop_codon:yes gene_type:complete
MADKPTSASTDDKKLEDMTLFEKVRAKTQEIKEKQEKRKKDAARPFNPGIGEGSTDDPSIPRLGGVPISPGGDGATETPKPDSGESFMKRMKRLNQESPTKLVEGEHDSVTDLLSNIPLGTTKKSRDKFKKITTTIYDKIKKSLPKGGYGPGGRFPIPGTFPDGVADKIKKSKRIPSTPPYAPKGNNKKKRPHTGVFSSPNPLDATINLGKTVSTKIGNSLSDLFGR